MKLSKETISILKNFSKVNNTFVVRTGSFIASRSPQGDVIAYTDVEEHFPVDCCIYDLGEFLASINIFNDDVELHFTDKKVTIQSADSKIIYRLANKVIFDDLVDGLPEHKPKRVLQTGYRFHLSKDDINRIYKSSSLFNLPVASFSPTGIELRGDGVNSSMNTFSIDRTPEILGDVNQRCDINISSVDLIRADYHVQVFTDRSAVVFTSIPVKENDVEVTYIIMFRNE